MVKDSYFLLMCMGIRQGRILFSLDLSILFSMNNITNAECLRGYLLQKRKFLDIILVSLGYHLLRKKPVEDFSIVRIL